VNTVTVKRSPIVLIRTFAIIEVLGFLGYIVLAQLDAYKLAIYRDLPLFSHLLSYSTAKVLFLSGAQFLITIYAFFRWYYETYNIRPGSVSHQKGVIWKKQKTIPLAKDISISSRSGLIGRLLHYGNIYLRNPNPGESLALKEIPYPTRYKKIIEQYAGARDREKQIDPAGLLKEDEHDQLEFKSSLRFDRRAQGINRDLERSAMKTVAAFLNSKGGNLMLGIGDRREPVGLEADYSTLERQSSDGFENHFTQVFNKMIGPEFRHLVKLSFHKIDGNEICLVDVSPAGQPIYLKLDNTEYFYVRTGNTTTPLKLSELEPYTRSRFSDES